MNLEKFTELLWLLHDQVQEEQTSAEQLQQAQTREAISLLRARGGVYMKDL